MAKSRKRRKLSRFLKSIPRAVEIFGPKKKLKAGPAAPRTTTHKTRSTWFRARVAWPMREAPIHALLRERERTSSTLVPQAGTAEWELAGPTNVGGRMTCVVCMPSNPDQILAGAAGGGVWKSDDGGQHWRALWHHQPTLNIGSLALDPKNPAIVYCGTGEANLSAELLSGRRHLPLAGQRRELAAPGIRRDRRHPDTDRDDCRRPVQFTNIFVLAA